MFSHLQQWLSATYHMCSWWQDEQLLMTEGTQFSALWAKPKESLKDVPTPQERPMLMVNTAYYNRSSHKIINSQLRFKSECRHAGLAAGLWDCWLVMWLWAVNRVFKWLAGAPFLPSGHDLYFLLSSLQGSTSCSCVPNKLFFKM